MRVLLGIEGPVLAGKSTLANNLRRLSARPLHIAPCYVDFATIAGVELPPVIGSSKSEQAAALRAYIDLDRMRFETLPDAGIVLLDRTLDTLLAHSHGIAAIGGPDVTRIAGRHYIQRVSAGVRPSLTFFVETRHSTQLHRMVSRHHMPPELVDPEFNRAFHDYFRRCRLEDPQRLKFLSAESDPLDMARLVLTVIEARAKMEML